MDIAKYKLFVRDTQLSDEDLTNLIKLVLEEIARDTFIFKDIFIFTLESCLDVYDFEDLYKLSQEIKQDNISTINITSNISTAEDLTKYIDSLNINSIDKTSCGVDDGVDVTIETENSSKNKLLNVNDIIYIESDKSDSVMVDKSTFKSVMFTWFNYINNHTYVVNKEIIESNTIYKYQDNNTFEIPLVCSCSIVPDPENISEDIEDIIRHTLIAGIKYYVSDMYLNINNEQVSNILYQRYYSYKKQLKFNYPTYIGSQLNRSKF